MSIGVQVHQNARRILGAMRQAEQAWQGVSQCVVTDVVSLSPKVLKATNAARLPAWLEALFYKVSPNAGAAAVRLPATRCTRIVPPRGGDIPARWHHTLHELMHSCINQHRRLRPNLFPMAYEHSTLVNRFTTQFQKQIIRYAPNAKSAKKAASRVFEVLKPEYIKDLEALSPAKLKKLKLNCLHERQCYGATQKLMKRLSFSRHAGQLGPTDLQVEYGLHYLQDTVKRQYYKRLAQAIREVERVKAATKMV